jgi:hypothetical protein
MTETDRKLGYAAAVSAARTNTQMPPNARLYLIRASLFCDDKGRTRYGPATYARDMSDTPENGQLAVNWLTAAGLIVNDVDDNGIECWRLTHYDWAAQTLITGYGPEAGLPRDGHPPGYGKPVHMALTPPTGNLNFTPPTWDQIAPTIAPPPQPKENS